jgi:hypothetical protein
VRSDEELALSVLRYGKILSRKLENRMQVSSSRAVAMVCLLTCAQIKEEHMEQLVPLLTTQQPLSCRTASEASRCLVQSPPLAAGCSSSPLRTPAASVVLNICYEKDNVHMVPSPSACLRCCP